MLMNQFHSDWHSDLSRRHEALPPGARLILLIDGAFVRGIFRQIGSACKPILLFESLPGCSKEARDVSPFVISFDPNDKSLVSLLQRCSGWPMLSVLVTYESVEQLAERLAAWCIVEVGGQNFNFRFPDTRRLPMIFETLTQQQRRELTGNAIEWHYISRDGGWSRLPLEPSASPRPISGNATLDESQFARLLKDSEPDEMWVQLLDRGARSDLLPAQRHALLANALYVADQNGLDELLKRVWCMDCIEKSCQSDSNTLRTRLAEWKQENSGSENEVVYQSV